MASPDLGKMYGPLPLGAWMAVIAGGLGLALYTRKQNSTPVDTNPDAQPEDTGTTPGVGVGGSGQWTDVTPPANGAADTSTAATNDEWGVMVIGRLIASGLAPAGPANSAITKFLNQGQLDAQEYQIASLALQKYGSPPTPVPGPYGPNAVVPPSTGSARWPAPKLPFFQYTIQSGDTLPVIASHYGTTAKNLYAWNAVILDVRARKTGNKTSSMGGKYIYAGTVITIPWGYPGQKYTP